MASYESKSDDWFYLDENGMPRVVAAQARLSRRFRFRPLLSLWREYLLAGALAPLVAILVVPLLLTGPLSAFFVSWGLFVAVGLAVHLWRQRWLWRFSRRVARLDTLREGRLVLHYDPKIRWDVSILLPRVQAELQELAECFGFPMRRRVAVYLFEDWREIAATFYPTYRGTALSMANAIVVADTGNLNQTIRHELAHLFAAQWGVAVPALLCEGVAVWAEGRDTDATAVTWLGRKSLRPSALLPYRTFYTFDSEERLWKHYCIAGSFTAFLIRRYGLAKLRRVYRWCDGTRFRAKFEYCFGVPIEVVEREWRDHLWAKFRLRERSRWYD